MADQPVIHSTFVIERRYPKPPEQVFAAFSDSEKKRRWFTAGEHHDLEEFEMDFRVGGAERLRYRFNENSPFPGVALTSEGSYQDIVPNRRIVMASTMAMADHRFSSSLLTIEVVPAEGGTDLICTHQGAFFEGADGPERREGGWHKLLDKLGESLA
ncbi:SRPBCC family protein [uncultured Paludibaculum sp.]|uniref:SRPBCC family protein n=1 Tax=uncultured Paludibaculum sp. TaxID=1765020 RepID=UPI002AAB6F65|nr:SRPBCC family protein [uncultured Paludibaculum sp.]